MKIILSPTLASNYPATRIVKFRGSLHFCVAGGEFRRLCMNGGVPQYIYIIDNNSVIATTDAVLINAGVPAIDESFEILYSNQKEEIKELSFEIINNVAFISI